MKTNRILTLATIAFAAFLTPAELRAADDPNTGDIVEIRAVDREGEMTFGSRSAGDPFRCTADHPLRAGDEVFFRVRMLVRNYQFVPPPTGQAPQEWSFKAGALGESLLYAPKLGIVIGDRVDGAVFSDYGPEPWMKSGTLKTDDKGVASTEWTYYTDFYFVYTVKPGDLGLPIRLANPSGTGPYDPADTTADYYLFNCSADGTSHYILQDTAGNVANFHYYPESLPTKVGWPTGTKRVMQTDLAEEGVFMKTVDFDKTNWQGEDWSAGEVWREVYAGLGPDFLPTLTVEGGARADATAVYIWSSDESKVLPAASGKNTIITVDGKKVLRVPIPAGDADSVSFSIKGADGAVEGDEADLFMSPTQGAVYKPTGELAGVTVTRRIRVGKAKPPTVRLYIDAQGTVTKTVEATPDYVTCETKLMLYVQPICPEDVEVELNGLVNGDDTMGSLREIWEANVLRLADGDFGGDPSTKEFPADGKYIVKIPGGTSVLPINLYTLGATSKTQKPGVTFSLAKTASTPSGVEVPDSNCTLMITKKTNKPVIVSSEPEFKEGENEGRIEIGSGSKVEFVLDIQDTYKNLNDTGWTFTLKTEGEDFTTPFDLEFSEDDGLFHGEEVEFSAISEGKELTLLVTAPNGTKSAVVKYWLVVTEGKYTTIRRYGDDRIVFCEGESTYVKLGLTQSYGGTGYIFLDADDPEQLKVVDSPITKEGAMISRGSTEVAAERVIRFLDGSKDLSLKAVLCSANNKTKTVSSFGAGTIEYSVTNKPPKVASVTAAGQYVSPDMAGKTLADPISRGVKKLFSAVIDDVDADLYAQGADAMQVKWVIDGETIVTNAIEAATSNAVQVAYTFNNEKDNALVQLFVKDKDMSGFPNAPTFFFYVKVKDTPRVEITTSSVTDTFLETDKAVSSIVLTLTEPASEDVTVRFRVQQVSDGGFVRLRLVDDGSVKEATDADGKVLPGEYDVTFTRGSVRKELRVADMDGTDDTLGGLDLNAVVTTTNEYQGVSWSNYYTRAESTLLRVQNVEPEILRPTAAEAAYTNENASANVAYKIYYGANDVSNDLHAAWTSDDGLSVSGVVVRITIDGTAKFTTNVTSTAVGFYEAKFDGEGTHIVEVAFTDKDGMTSRRTVNFFVKPSKRLQLRAHGPAGALGTTGGYSMHYGAAAGLGAGRVYAGEQGPQSVAGWVHSYSFGENETAVNAYAFGYKADGRADDGTLSTKHDQAIDANGDFDGAKTPTVCYNYSTDHKYGLRGYDSFLYGWACNNTEASNSQTQNAGGGTTTTTPSFLLNIGAAGETLIPLPSADNNNNNNGKATSYPVQYWEAVFSREWLKTDNCGDINQDGIPDIMVYNFGMGIVDTSTYKLITSESGGGSGEGALKEGDLTDLKDWNKDVDKDGAEDPDYLPATETAAYASFIPGLKESWVDAGVEFGAKREIRGYGDGLNDALELLGATDIASDRVYEDPDLSPTSTLSKVEFLAWSEYKAAHPTATEEDWSPERPTKPTRSDTDGDKFPDGYEYYFWYRAHVGYMDGDVHRYLTGRRYDPRNPGEGKFISSATIARMMDPRSDLSPVDFPEGYFDDPSSAETRDTDNDGLPDLLEFEIGTNPFDFDTDGDGLPDGWEVMFSGTDPLDAYTTEGVLDAARNYDGDAMAIATPALEAKLSPKPTKIDALYKFALVDPKGDTDGIQWYVAKESPTNFTVEADGQIGTSVKVGDVTYVTKAPVPVVTNVTAGLAGSVTNVVLAADLAKEVTWTTVATNTAPKGVETTAGLIALMPTRIAAGTAVSDVKPGATYATLRFNGKVAAMTAWPYGKEMTIVDEAGKEFPGGFGFLAVGRYPSWDKDDKTLVPTNAAVAALPAEDGAIGYLHSLVYQEFGFDPRTAWCAKGDLNERPASIMGNARKSARTRAYTCYDEFLVYSFLVNTGMGDRLFANLDDKAPEIAKVWAAETTNPQGPNEPDIDVGGAGEGENARAYYGKNSDQGADTDLDGIPDGWELYVMAGPKDLMSGEYVFVGADCQYSPFKDFGAEQKTDSGVLTMREAYAGTDSCNYYVKPQDGAQAAYSTTITRPDKHAKWLNKFFPSDPWVADTDGDGVEDDVEAGKSVIWLGTKKRQDAGNFVYGDPADSGKLAAIPGGGLNPCAVDTDYDGLPDGWEVQFAGFRVYDGENAAYAPDEDGKQGNPLQGLVDGMDGTVPDAFNSVKLGEEFAIVNFLGVGMPQDVDRDYDHDGLENWQEYLTGAMRCWRYDDPLSRWDYVPQSWYYDETGAFRPWRENGRYLKLLGLEVKRGATPKELEAQFWYETLFNAAGPAYNPHLVTETSSGAQYFTRVSNLWDPGYDRYYIFCDRIADKPLAGLWGDACYGKPFAAPLKYISCSPILADSDKDGMDDYYEVFHGLNPLLGESGVAADSEGPCDLVYDAWYNEGIGGYEWQKRGVVQNSPVNARANKWTDDPLKTRGRLPRVNPDLEELATGANANIFDFELFPWLNGLATADPDGDDIRNQSEAIMALVAPSSIYSHTDPTPLWMTDSSYTNSLVYRFFRLPATFGEGTKLPGATFTYKNQEYSFHDRDGYTVRKTLLGEEYLLAPFQPDHWGLLGEGAQNWFVSFEENEGYDSDHDAIADNDELAGAFKVASDPQDFDSPHRRQAMYFPGKDAALQSLPEVAEDNPRRNWGYPDEPAFAQYTVECWVMPETVDPNVPQTVIERAVWTDWSNGGDQELLRRNFQIAIRSGRWYTKFDSGTLSGTCVEVLGDVPAEPAKWTHVAATYGNGVLKLYVNGVAVDEKGRDGKGLKPEYGSSAVVVHPGENNVHTNGIYLGRGDSYWYDRDYALSAFLIGASFKGLADIGYRTSHLNVENGAGWSRYKDFFNGWVDEVRVWDGARSSGDISRDMMKRYTAADAKQNRDKFYEQWAQGKRRYDKDGNGQDVEMIPELRYHWTFDSVPGAANAAQAAKAAHGFGWNDAAGTAYAGFKAPYSRPVGYEIGWWSQTLAGYGSVYDNPECVTWIPNTLAHLPRFDGTTLDSFYWAEDIAGGVAGTYRFARTAEPVSRWTQYVCHQTRTVSFARDGSSFDFESTPRRFWVAYNADNGAFADSAATVYEFTGRHLNQKGDDLVPLGGAYVKYVSAMWDEQGPSTAWEITGEDANANRLPDWWERYAIENYNPADPDNMDWDTLVDYNGRRIPAGQAYLSDLAKGYHAGADGNIVIDPAATGALASIADEDRDGMPDWWEEMVGLHDGSTDLSAGHANEDPDNDGLSNYVEYLLGEELRFGVFNPRAWSSAQPGIPDYFFRPAGSKVYVGEVFTDHDRMYDTWEDQYPVSQLSRLVWDADGDPDGDGWSNLSEMLAGTDPTRTRSQGLEEQVIADYPVPMIRTRVKIPDNLPESTPIVVQAFSKSLDGKPDAIWKTGASGGSFAKEKFIGTNPGGVRHYYLSPGSISPGKVDIAFNDESAVTYTYTIIDGNPTLTKSVITGSGWDYCVSDKLRPEGGMIGDLVMFTGDVVGWINYATGEIEIDFTDDALQETAYVGETGTAGSGENAQATETRTVLDLTRAYVKFAWSAKLVKQGSLSDLYLSDADEGYVREGKNTFVAWVDIDGSGTWQPGEPYGIVRDVDVSWSGTKAEIELTALSPVTPRILLVGSSEGGKQSEGGKSGESSAASEGDPSSDRGKTFDQIRQEIRSRAIFPSDCKWIDNNRITPASISGSFKGQRIRVVRWLVNDVPVHRAGAEARVVLDKKIETDVRNVLTEADFLVGTEAFDLDWADLSREVINNPGTISALGGEEVRRVSYLIVVGDGATGWAVDSSTNEVIALSSVITRHYGEKRVVPVPVAPGAVGEEIVYSANPTFKWTMNCPEEEGYTAFRIQVLDGSTVVYDSDLHPVPPRNAEGQYVWEAPLYVGDMTGKGRVFENKKVYGWKVAMYNAKFSQESAAGYSAASAAFRMQVQTNSLAYGAVDVAVRYYGPETSWSKKNPVIRVRAYASPDFTGIPVAAGYVADATTVTSLTKASNCSLIGIPPGTYYLQAFIDSDGDGVCAPWETQGCLCTRDGTSADYLTPTAITVDAGIGAINPVVIYLEDADTDADGLPDAWEYAESKSGSLMEKGVELLAETKVGEFVVNPTLSSRAVRAAFSSAMPRAMSRALSTPEGVSLMTGIDPADIEVTDGGLVVKSEVDPETLTITGFNVDAANKRVILKVGAETTANVDAAVANFLNIRVQKGATVTVKIESAATPAGPWNVLDGVSGTVTVDKAGTDVEVNLSGELPAQGFFRAKIEE